MHRIRHEPLNGLQPWVVYHIEGQKEKFRAAFGSIEAAQRWVDHYGIDVF